MLKWRFPLFVLGLAAIYSMIVAAAGFEGPVALTINLARVSLGAIVLILYVPAMEQLFVSVPPPGRDYLITGIILTWMSNEMFAVGNEFGRIFHVDMSIFTNAVAGFSSLVLVLGGVFHVLAPRLEGRRRTQVAVGVGAIWGVLVVFVAPLFR